MTPLLWELLPHFCVVAITVLMLGLFHGINRRLRRLQKRTIKMEASREAEAAELKNAINELKHKFAELEKHDAQLADAPVEPGLSDIARAKVLKMHRVGHKADHIAETLRLPKGEVELLVKVHRVVMQPYRDLGVWAGQGQG
jgi:hypothetical protein